MGWQQESSQGGQICGESKVGVLEEVALKLTEKGASIYVQKDDEGNLQEKELGKRGSPDRQAEVTLGRIGCGETREGRAEGHGLLRASTWNPSGEEVNSY